MLEVIVKRGDVKAEEAQAGATKVFFKAGVLAALEELRDAYLSKIIVTFQCLCLWYVAEVDAGRRKKQL
jgi:myosin heavy subunit